MARHALLLNHHPLIFTISHMAFPIATFLLCALALFMCATHNPIRWRKRKSREPVIQQQINGYQFGDVDPSGGDHGSLWQKNILMGGKCQLPDFSGVIIYDSAGNVVPTAKANLALPWR